MTREAPGDVQPSGLHRISNDNLNVDPYGLVSAVLHERSAPADGHSPRDCLINWLLDLPADLDPAVAARQLLTQRPDSPPSERADCMASLLAETAAHPRPHPDRRRRQRRQAVQQPRHDVGRHTTCVRSDGLEPRRGGRGS